MAACALTLKVIEAQGWLDCFPLALCGCAAIDVEDAHRRCS